MGNLSHSKEDVLIDSLLGTASRAVKYDIGKRWEH